jgi:hypothetical protein
MTDPASLLVFKDAVEARDTATKLLNRAGNP